MKFFTLYEKLNKSLFSALEVISLQMIHSNNILYHPISKIYTETFFKSQN